MTTIVFPGLDTLAKTETSAKRMLDPVLLPALVTLAFVYLRQPSAKPN
jgi:hypothetical protein